MATINNLVLSNMFDEYIKISLHNHFGGKGWQRTLNKTEPLTDFDINYAKKHIDNAKENAFKMLGFTNHNIFSLENYNNLKKYAEQIGINLLPGCEFDYVSEIPPSKEINKTLHTVVIFDPDSDLQSIQHKIDAFITKNGCNCINTEQLVDILVIGKCIVIPHGALKQGSSKRNATHNLEQFKEILAMRNFIPIFIEDSRPYHKAILLEKIKEDLSEEAYEYLDCNVVSVSAADENDFDKIQIPTYLWGENSFDSLFYAALLGEKRVIPESDISIKSKYIKKMVIENEGGALQSSTITFSHGLNTIIGNSGSGKTLLLNLLNKKMTGKNLVSSVSSNECNYDEMYKLSKVTLYDNNNNIIQNNDINVFEGENLYKQILSTLKSDKNNLLILLNAKPDFNKFDELISDFNSNAVSYIRNGENILNLNNEISDIIKLIISSTEYLMANSVNRNYLDYTTNEKLLSELNSEIQSHEHHEQNLNDIINLEQKLISLGKEYSVLYDDAFFNKIKFLKNTIKTKSLESQMNKYVKEARIFIQNKMFSLVNEFNSMIGDKFKTFMFSKQNINMGVEKIVEKLKKTILTKAANISPALEKNSLLNSFSVSNMSVKLSNKNLCLEISYDDLTKMFEPSIGSANNKVNKSLFKHLFVGNRKLDLTNHENVKEILDVFISNKAQIYSLIDYSKPDFVSYDIQLKISNNDYKDISSFSAGELSKIYINKLINEKLSKFGNNAIILYDQPDNNLEKRFILDTLCEKLCELKKTYQIFITTHEPLLVVNADSNSIIHARHQKTVGGTSVITFENKSFINSTSKAEAVNEIAQIIDGSQEAVKLRSKIYGGMKDA